MAIGKIIHKSSKPMFTKKDITKSDDMLRAMLVKIFIDREITYSKFCEAHKKYMLDIGALPSQITSDRNNLLKTLLYKNRLTYKRFEMILRHILGLNLAKVSLLFKDESNHEYFAEMDRRTY